MRELLFLTHRIPYPPNKGDKIRSFHLLKHLAENYRVHLGTFVDDTNDWRHMDVLRQMCDQTCFVALNPRWARLCSLAALVRNQPLTLQYYRNSKLKRWTEGILRKGTVQRVLVFSSSMAQYAPSALLDETRRVLDFVDMDSDKWRQYSRGLSWPISWVYKREGVKLFDFERRQAKRFDASVFVSESEAELFRRQAPEAASRVTHIENGVDSDYFTPDQPYSNPYRPGEEVLVFTGAMDYWANVDAVAWFAREVFPKISAHSPAARFYIVGSNPTEKVLGLARMPGVHVTGSVADIRPYLAHARMAVAPLRIARGVQNKVLEAMAMAKTVLASPQAMEGIQQCPASRPLIIERPLDAAQSAIDLLAGKEDLSALGRSGRQFVLEHYDWEVNMKRMACLLEGTTELPV